MVSIPTIRVIPAQAFGTLPALNTSCEKVRVADNEFALAILLVPPNEVLNHKHFRDWFLGQVELITQGIGEAVKSLKGIEPERREHVTNELVVSLREQLTTQILAACGLGAAERQAILGTELSAETKIILVRSTLLETALDEVVPPNLREQLLERPKLLEQFFDCWFHSSDPDVINGHVLEELSHIDQKLKWGFRPSTVEVEYRVDQEPVPKEVDSQINVVVH